jgi:hypothetical protein
MIQAPSPHEAAACGGVCLAHFFPRDAGAALARLPTLPALNCLLAGPAHRRVAARLQGVFHRVVVVAFCQARTFALTRLSLARSGKTTLLFTYAVNAAADGGRAVFLCRRERLEAAPPLLPPHRAPQDALRRVDMRCARSCCSSPCLLLMLRSTPLMLRYLADDRELRRWCSSMHLLSAQPHCIAVDDLSSFVDARCVTSPAADGCSLCACWLQHSVLTKVLLFRSFPDRRAREAALAKVLGLLHEAAAHASARLAAAAGAAADSATLRGSAEADPPLTPRRPPPRCQLVVSDRGGADGEGPPLLFVYQRWMPLILAVRTRGDGGGGGGAAGGTCALQVLPTDDGPQDPTGAQQAEHRFLSTRC